MVLADRMLRAALLKADVYEEVEADTAANGQATIVVVLASLAAGAGAVERHGPTGVALAVLVALLGWYVWALLTYVIGTRVLSTPQTRADLGQLLRTIGFSASPGVLRVFAGIPLVGGLIAGTASAWMLVAMIVAVRQALDYESTARAFLVCLIGWLVQFGMLLLSGAMVWITRGG